MKILYVEDELSKDVPRITRLFDKQLSEKRIRELQALERDESGYGATPEEVKKIVEDTHVIDVEYRFPDALRKIIHHYDQYVLFIIDRNLSESEYTLEEVREIDPDYDETQDKKYSGREGDYLLLKLGLQGHANVIENVYFLTAYPAQDELRNHQEIEALVDLRRFKRENFIEKGSHSDLKRLQDKVTNLDVLLKTFG